MNAARLPFTSDGLPVSPGNIRLPSYYVPFQFANIVCFVNVAISTVTAHPLPSAGVIDYFSSTGRGGSKTVEDPHSLGL
jgi:hypothetical protein